MSLVPCNNNFISEVLLVLDQQVYRVEEEGYSFCEVDGQLTVEKNPKTLLTDVGMIKKVHALIAGAQKVYISSEFVGKSDHIITFFKKRTLESTRQQKLFDNIVVTIETIFQNLFKSNKMPNILNSTLTKDLESVLKKADPLSEQDYQFLINIGIFFYKNRKKRTLYLVRDFIAREIELMLKQRSIVKCSRKRQIYYVHSTFYQIKDPEVQGLLQVLQKNDYYITPPEANFDVDQLLNYELPDELTKDLSNLLKTTEFQKEEKFDVSMLLDRELSDEFIKDLFYLLKTTKFQKEKEFIENLLQIKKASILIGLIIKNRENLLEKKITDPDQCVLLLKYLPDPLLRTVWDFKEINFCDIEQKKEEEKWNELINFFRDYFNSPLTKHINDLYACVWDKINRQKHTESKKFPPSLQKFQDLADEKMQYKEGMKLFISLQKKFQVVLKEVEEELNNCQKQISIPKPVSQKKKKRGNSKKRIPTSQNPVNQNQLVEEKKPTVQTNQQSKREQGKQEEEIAQQPIQRVELEEKKEKNSEEKQLVPSLFTSESPFLCFEYPKFMRDWFDHPDERVQQYMRMHLSSPVSGKNLLFSHRAPLVLDKIAFLCGYQYTHYQEQPSLALVCWIDFPKYQYQSKEKVLTLGFQKPFYASEKTFTKQRLIHRSFMGNLPIPVKAYQKTMQEKKDSGKYVQEKMPLEIEQLVGQKAPDGSCITKIEGRGCTIQMQVQDSDCTIFVVV